jgi:hypothetical protein
MVLTDPGRSLGQPTDFSACTMPGLLSTDLRLGVLSALKPLVAVHGFVILCCICTCLNEVSK